MTIYSGGSLNAAAMIVPDLAVVILPPDGQQINGVPTNVVGFVGTAAWGPKNTPVPLSDMAGYARRFGPMQNRKYDLGTAIALAVLQGANNFRAVRVTDGTDVAASIVILTNCLTVTSKYTGSLANADSISIGPGSQASTFKATVVRPGQQPEVFDNIGAGLTGNAVWVAIAAAINNGQGALRPPSDYVTASAGVGVTAPATASYTLASGTDGVATITSTVLLGVDTTPRTGMYALRGTGASIVVLADCDTSASWPTQVTYGLSEGSYMILVGPAGDTVSNAATVKASTGIDTYIAKLLHGDWLYYLDPVNNVLRLVSPQGAIAGSLANKGPHISPLNKPIYGIVGTQKSYSEQIYSAAELQILGAAGIDVICNPSIGGNYFSPRFGRNSSSNPNIRQDTYTRMTNFIAATINQGMGDVPGQNQSPALRLETKARLEGFFVSLRSQGMIGNADGTEPFSVQIDSNNNPSQRVVLGYMQADIRVQYLSVVEYFVANFMGGQSVQITRKATEAAQLAA